MLGLPQRSERALSLALRPIFGRSPTYLYFEDSWKITPRLTLNAGLRYEITPPWYEPNRRIMNIQMFGWGPDARTPIMTRPGEGDFNDGLQFRFADVIPTQTGDDKMGRATIQTDRTDFAPRIGLAWSPTSNWSIRLGGGLFYTQDQGNPRFDIARNLAGRGDFTGSDLIPNSTLDDPWRSERQSFTCSNWSGNCVGQPFVLGNVNSRRTPYVGQWLFNIQRELPGGLAIETGYMGNVGRKLERLRSTNEPFLRKGLNDTTSIQARRPFAIYGIIQQVDGVVNSNYHALNLKITKRFTRGLNVLAGYTWSKSIDDASGIRSSSGEQSIAKWDWNLQDERGLSQFHTGQRLVLSAIYEIPFFADAPRAARAVLGGWQGSGIITAATGNPVRVSAIGDTNNIGGEGNYPDATGISPTTNAGWADRFWNIAAFDISNPELRYRFGNVGRNVLIGPGYSNVDLSLLKNIATPWEGHRLQFRWEVFNGFNHANWNVPASDARNAATFGRVLSARPMRQMQFALKYLF
ncbi:MAG: TonB-dependent receptor [Bryobacteraceae bacterium]